MKQVQNDFRLSRALEILLGIVVVLEIIAPVVCKTYGVDAPSQLNLESQFNAHIAQGVIFPRWMSEGFHGFGAPSFYFYPPLSFYSTAILSLITTVRDPWVLFQAVGLLATIASFFSARKLLLTLGSNNYQSIIGSMLYAFAPYRVAELYSMSSLSSHVGYVFVPLVWCGILQIVNNRNGSHAKGVILFAISVALMLLSNIPLTLLTAVSIAIVGAVFWRKLDTKTIGQIGAGVILAALLAAFYLCSILAMRPNVQLGYLYKTREFFLDDLIHLRNLPGLYHVAILYTAIAAIAVGYWQARKHKKELQSIERIAIRAGLAICLFIILLEIPFIGSPLLGSVPLLQLIQGTWRFYIDIVLLGAIVVGIAKSDAIKKAGRRIVWVMTLAAFPPVLLIVFNIHLYPHYIAAASDPFEYAPVYTLKNGAGLEAMLHLHSEAPPAIVSYVIDNDRVDRVVKKPCMEEYNANLSASRSVIFHRFFWPAWHLYSNEREIATLPDSIGRATAVLPAGRYTLEWQLERTPLEVAGLWISGISWSGILVFSGIGLVRWRVKKKRPTSLA